MTREEAVSALDVVALVGEYIPLLSTAHAAYGDCPFHDDRDSGLAVFPTTKRVHCRVCGPIGDAVDFVARYECVSAELALRWVTIRIASEV